MHGICNLEIIFLKIDAIYLVFKTSLNLGRILHHFIVYLKKPKFFETRFVFGTSEFWPIIILTNLALFFRWLITSD